MQILYGRLKLRSLKTNHSNMSGHYDMYEALPIVSLNPQKH
jgi:hypothetical protein